MVRPICFGHILRKNDPFAALQPRASNASAVTHACHRPHRALSARCVPAWESARHVNGFHEHRTRFRGRNCHRNLNNCHCCPSRVAFGRAGSEFRRRGVDASTLLAATEPSFGTLCRRSCQVMGTSGFARERPFRLSGTDLGRSISTWSPRLRVATTRGKGVLRLLTLSAH